MKRLLFSLALMFCMTMPTQAEIPAGGRGGGGEGGWINVPGGGSGGCIRLYVVQVVMANGHPYLLAVDPAGSRADLVDPNLLTEVQFALSPQILSTSWKDRAGMNHDVRTNCANITIEECMKRHDKAVQELLKLYPAVVQ